MAKNASQAASKGICAVYVNESKFHSQVIVASLIGRSDETDKQFSTYDGQVKLIIYENNPHYTNRYLAKEQNICLIPSFMGT